ncbi:MAG: acetyl-CoA carboxylase biotin carboxyl carrier protein [Lentisphaeria bacterium]|nr:acetyl-CoA carboxylase biotin carboxyl carrier protein [Lentisphaeria bacterium]
MKIEEIKTIVKLMSENDLTEFKIESEDMTLCLRRGSVAAPIIAQPVAAPAPAIIPAAAAAAPAAAPAVAAPAAAPVASEAKPDKNKIIESPIVGTFYRAGAPGAEPMVKVGSRVDSETVVCIVEAMKVMNEIKAEKSGVVKEILVENGQPVEFGQPLFVLE